MITSIMWVEITYQFQKLNIITFEVCEWMSNIIPHETSWHAFDQDLIKWTDDAKLELRCWYSIQNKSYKYAVAINKHII